jgi:putative flippase GtrA
MTFFRTLVAKAKKTHIIRFVVVGLLNTGFSYLIYAALLHVGLGYQTANLMALVIGVLFSFKTQGRLAFCTELGCNLYVHYHRDRSTHCRGV